MSLKEHPISRRGFLSTAAIAVVSTPASVLVSPLTSMAASLPKSVGSVDMEQVLTPGPLKEVALGNENAPVKIVEYLSTTCGACADFHISTFDAIKTKYIDTGKVYFVIREFPFDPRAVAAFMLARSVPHAQYLPFLGLLLKNQDQWVRVQDGRGALLQMSKLAGFTEKSFEASLMNQKLLDDVTASMERGAKQFGVNSAPTFIVNGSKYVGAISVGEMSAIIDNLI